MKARLGQAPSFIWRSIWSTQTLLNERLVWRVRNDRDISIQGHKQISKASSFTTVSPVKILNENVKVGELMMKELRGQNENLIYEIFKRNEAVNICSIPLSRMDVKDEVIQGYTKDGLFLVRNAYHWGMSLEKDKKGETSIF